VNGPLFNNPVKSGIDQVGTTNKQLVPVEHPPAQEYISPDEWSSMNPHGTGTINAPSRVGSTQFDRNQLYGNAPVQRQLPAAPFKFTIPGNSPIEVRVDHQRKLRAYYNAQPTHPALCRTGFHRIGNWTPRRTRCM
jgi:hypothetical protein